LVELLAVFNFGLQKKAVPKDFFEGDGMKKTIQRLRSEGEERHSLDTVLGKKLRRRSFLKSALATAPLLMSA